MILRPKQSLPHYSAFAAIAAASSVTSVPSWLRRAVPNAQNLAGNEIEDVAVVTGTAIGALDADEGVRAKSLLAAQARAALRAVDLSAELGRRSERLLAVAPKLRARAS
ncbi:MAG: hypothetical protein ACTHJQ_07325, partial [Rhizobiaceae bacterium]